MMKYSDGNSARFERYAGDTQGIPLTNTVQEFIYWAKIQDF